MSTLKTPDGVNEVINARRTESVDAVAIQKLVTSETEAQFGVVNIINLIERALLAVTLTNLEDQVLAHSIFLDYPDIEDVKKDEWEGWLSTSYGANHCNALNTLFLRHFAAKPEYAHGAAAEIVKTAFNAVPSIHYIYLVCQPGAFPEAALADIFEPVNHNGSGASPSCSLFVCPRDKFMPVLFIRQARVEDHDDLAPIFNKQSKVLKNTYGDYFLAELIEAQNDHMYCLAAEVEGTAIGFMSVSDTINLDILNKCFELSAFHGLRKPHPDDVLEKPRPKTETPPAVASPVRETSINGSEGGDDGRSSKAETEEEKENGVKDEEEEKEEEETAVQTKLAEVVATESSSSLPPEVAEGETELVENEDEERLEAGEDGEAEEGLEKTMDSDPSMNEPVPVSEVPEVLTRITPVPPPNTAVAVQQSRFTPTFCGEPNAVVVQLFAMDERYEMRSLDFMPMVFDLFPNADFAVITVPPLVPEFPLLQNFVRVTPRFNSTLAHELYVFHKGGLISNFHVRKCKSSDAAGVEKLVNNLHLNDCLLQDMKTYNRARRDPDGTEVQMFVAECMTQVVGVCILRREENIEYVRSHYAIEDFVYFNHHHRHEHGHIYHFALNPIFAHLTKTFLKEVMRLGDKTCLYYPIYPTHAPEEIQNQHSLITALTDLVPVRARRQIIYPLDVLKHNSPSDRVLKKHEPYSLSHINRKLILEPKVSINARIVVVGASSAGLSFLQALVFCPHLRFNNLTLVSPHGLPGDLVPDQLRDSMLGTDHCYSQEDFAHISLRSRVNVVYGKMTAINRKKKYLTINENSLIPYDHLVLATGLQFMTPCPISVSDLESGLTRGEVVDCASRRFFGKAPKNVFTVNDQYDAGVFLYWVENHLLNKDSSPQMVIYGESLQSYCTIATLVELGLTPSAITLVLPPPSVKRRQENNERISVFNNPVVETAVNDALSSLGVNVIQNVVLLSWNNGEQNPELVSSVQFGDGSGESQSIECSAMLSFYERMVDYDSFKAINDACIVFDGRLVIDSNFHTNDVSIRGVGPLTKYQRKYHMEGWGHEENNSKVVGEQLAYIMLRLFDPVLDPLMKPPVEHVTLVPLYDGPKIQGGVLPGGYHYLTAGKPSLLTPFKPITDNEATEERHLVTGSPDNGQGYFLLHVNQHGSIETITCLSKKEFPVSNILCLYGIHERILNSLVARFNEKLITDFYEYFRGAWCMAVFHDRFKDFKDEVRELLIMQPMNDHESLETKVRAMIEEDLGLTAAQRSTLREEYRKTGSKRAVELRVLSFISYNYYHLPMYAKPGMVA